MFHKAWSRLSSMSMRDTRTRLSMLLRTVSGKDKINSEYFQFLGPPNLLQFSMISYLFSGYSQQSDNSVEDLINDVGRVNYLQGYLTSISSAVR